ncbi:hypothetical protein ABW19_dt0209659 [Dactylella cylindrospora]|nr:hypothetical protein ABW19_dt0209659 [Dactylella cylindrospora]
MEGSDYSHGSQYHQPFWSHNPPQPENYFFHVPSGASPRPRASSANPDVLSDIPTGPFQLLHNGPSDPSLDWMGVDIDVGFFGSTLSPPVPFSMHIPPRPPSQQSLATNPTQMSGSTNTISTDTFVESQEAPVLVQASEPLSSALLQSSPIYYGPQPFHTEDAPLANPSPSRNTQIVYTQSVNKKKRRNETLEDAPGERRSRVLKKGKSNRLVNVSPQAKTRFDDVVTLDIARRRGFGAKNPLPEDKKREKARVRENGGGCFRCRMLNKKCISCRERCPQCRASPQLCFRLDLQDCCYFRATTPLHSKEVSVLDKRWASDSLLILQFHCVPLKIARKCRPLKVTCREFEPQLDDNLSKSPEGAHPERLIDVAPYVAYRPDDMYQTLLRNMASYREAFYDELMLDGASTVTLRVMDLAERLARERQNGLIHGALDVWVGAHLAATERSLCGEELLGQPPDGIDDRTSPLFGLIPIPPQLDNQLDNHIIRGMKDKASKLLKNIWTKLKNKKKVDWLELWITTYIMLNTVEFVTGIQQRYAKNHRATAYRDSVLAHWEHYRRLWAFSANHIIDAFQYYHGKVKMPLGPVLRRESLQNAQSFCSINLDSDSLRLLRQIGEAIQAETTNATSPPVQPESSTGQVDYATKWTSKIIFISSEVPQQRE